MTTAEFTNTEAASKAPVRMVDGGRMVIRGAQRMLGVSLGLAALGLWLAPGASWENDAMLFKMILSLMALLAAGGLLHASVTPKMPEVEIDTIRREVRLMREASDGSAAVLERCTFANLSRVEREGNHMRLWGAGSTLLAEVTLTNKATLDSLLAGLRDEGKIV